MKLRAFGLGTLDQTYLGGNVLHYQATAHDPDVLAKRWVMDPRTFILNTNRVTQVEDPPCIESDGQNHYIRERG